MLIRPAGVPNHRHKPLENVGGGNFLTVLWGEKGPEEAAGLRPVIKKAFNYLLGVNFAALGYGDIVMSERWRLPGPIEAANGILMFGVSTAMITAAVMEIVKAGGARLAKNEGR